jgi:hypothetical protein
MTLKKSLVGAVAVVSTLVVAGCGSAADISGAQGASLNRSGFAAAVTDATAQVRSVHMSGSFTAQGQHVTVTGDSSFGDHTLTGAEGAFKVTLPAMGTLQARLVGGVVYVNAAQLGLGQVGGKPWLKVDLADPNNPVGAMFAKVTDNLGPGQIVATLKHLSTLRSLGSATVDGVSATHYRVTVETSKLGSALGLDPSQLGTHARLPKQMSYDVWVDASARPVKVSMNQGSFAVELHFSRWNEPVHVVAPPASQVSTFSL